MEDTPKVEEVAKQLAKKASVQNEIRRLQDFQRVNQAPFLALAAEVEKLRTELEAMQTQAIEIQQKIADTQANYARKKSQYDAEKEKQDEAASKEIESRNELNRLDVLEKLIEGKAHPSIASEEGKT